MECQQELHSRGLLGELELHETWTREYQVLPSRTHPTMMTHGASGYLLTGTKVESFDETKQDHTIKICDGGDADAGDEPPKKRQRKR